MKELKEITEYIRSFPPETQKKLEQLRKCIQKAAPQASEVISYGMPAYKLHTVLVYFAGYANHIGFYPTASPIKLFQAEFAAYKSSKGAIQFPINKPIPNSLVTKIVKFRINEDNERLKEKSKRICKNGHTYYKSSDCPTCPLCENERKPTAGFMVNLSAPARRALENAGIKTLKQVAKHSEKSLLNLHGFGPASIPVLKAALKKEGLSFKA